MKWLLCLLLLASCAEEVESDSCMDWTWIEEESCSIDICADTGADFSTCRQGECWCCLDDECWAG